MARVRLAASAAVMFVLLLGAAAWPPPPRSVPMGAAAVVGWPPSEGLVVAEVVTGGASASDEYVELANTGTAPVDLAGLEVVYVTSSGATVSRKAAWTASMPVEPGRRVLLANTLGIHAAMADATYSGGLAATGGSIVLRPAGGLPIDAVGWGDALSSFVEGTAAPAPVAGASIERDDVDTNDNSVDFTHNPAPVAQGLAWEPSPSSSPSGSPTPTAEPSPTAEPTPAPSPTAEPTPAPTMAPTPAPSPSPVSSPTPATTPTPLPTSTPTPVPTPTPTPIPTPTSPPEPTPGPTESPAPTESPSQEPSPSPSPTPTAVPASPISDARDLEDGAAVVVEGTLTTALGDLEGGRAGFVQDPTAGIAVYLDAELAPAVPAGSRVRLAGTLDSRYAQRTLRVAAGGVVVLGSDALPAPATTATGEAGEPVEGLRLTVTGTVTEAPSDLSDGLGLMVDDGTGPVRVIVGPSALGVLDPARGGTVTATGPLGQRDSGGTGLAGYRLYATLPGELVVEPPLASPSPTANPTPTASPAPSSSPAPTASPTPTTSATPTASPSAGTSPTPTTPASTTPLTVAAGREVAVGGAATVRGVVIAEAGRLGTPSLLAIGDASGGLPVRLADGQVAPERGALVELRGIVAAPYGQTELRLVAGGLSIIGLGDLPPSVALGAAAVNEGTEGRLARVSGTITAGPTRATSGDIAFTIRGTDGSSLRVMADGSAGLATSSLRIGTTTTVTGIVGQRASRKGALDGYRLWVRDSKDVLAGPASSATASASASPRATATPAAPRVTIALARGREGRHVTIEGTVTVATTLLDATGRRTVVEDGTAAIELYLARADASIRPGVRVRASGVVGRAWGALRLRVDAVRVVGRREPSVLDLRATPGATAEWRLVRIRGTVADVHRSGDRWTAELVSDGLRIPVVGLPGGGIAASAVQEGRRATVTGIVRRPYPTATDQRFAVAPRSARDLALGPAITSASQVPGTTGGAPSGTAAPGRVGSSGSAPGSGLGGSSASSGADISLADLSMRLATMVRVGGLVTAVEADGFLLDDGTATATVVLEGPATEIAALLQPGDAVNAVGTPEVRDEVVLVVTDPSGVVLLGDPGDDGDPSSGGLDAPAGAGGVDGAGDATTGALDSAGLVAGRSPGSLAAVLAALSLMGVMTVAFVAHRAVTLRRRSRAHIQARLDAIVAAPAQRAGPDPAA